MNPRSHRDPPASEERRRSKPTPVRALQDVETSPPTEPSPPTEETSVTIEGVAWSVRVDGEAEGPGGARGPHLLFLRFDEEGADGDDASARSAWVVGDRLGDVPAARLEDAFRRAQPWTTPDQPRSFFEDASARRGR
ncbi:MAG: hypothetical protein U5R14_04060 [Gemmatimonadota bacterium]|nr:hypothetical protein [Gemmatimonadota bacterium]